MIVFGMKFSSNIFVQIEEGDTLTAVALHTTGDATNFPKLKLVDRKFNPKNRSTQPIHPKDVFLVPKDIILPAVAVDCVI